MNIENIGPHDHELVHLLIDWFDVTDEDTLNTVVDKINEIFSAELEESWMYRELQ